MRQKRIAVVTIGSRIPEECRKAFMDSTAKLLSDIGFELYVNQTDDHEASVREVFRDFLPRSHIEAVLLCDVDVFVTNKRKFFNWITQAFIDKVPMAGIVQNANHIPGSKDYVAPGFCLLNGLWWRNARRIEYMPQLKTDQWDLLGAHSRFVEMQLAEVRKLYPTMALSPEWRLSNETPFGPGTYYDEAGLVHVFGVRDRPDCQRLCVWLGKMLKGQRLGD